MDNIENYDDELKVIGKIFNMLGFNDIDVNDNDKHICYQKSIYLLQKFGISLGCGFGFYARGPYSREVHYRLNKLQKYGNNFDDFKDVKFKNDDDISKRVYEFLELFGNKLKDPLYMEVFGTLLYIKFGDCLSNIDTYVKLLNIRPWLKEKDEKICEDIFIDFVKNLDKFDG